MYGNRKGEYGSMQGYVQGVCSSCWLSPLIWEPQLGAAGRPNSFAYRIF